MSDFRTPTTGQGFLNERSWIVNGRFIQNLNGWVGAGGAVYIASDGSEQYGLASLPAGASISQPFAVINARLYTLHLAVKTGNATVVIADNLGSTLATITATGAAGAWAETVSTLGLAPGTSYQLTITNNGVSTILVDDIWIWYVPATRAALAARVARKLSTLATDASLSYTAAGTLTEGDYTDAIDAGMRAIGAINPETDLPDVRYLDSSTIDSLADQVEREMLERLSRYYATLTDIEAGPRKEKLSQIGAAIGRMTSAPTSGGAKVVARQLRRYTPDYEL
jgi:hypothetical protein